MAIKLTAESFINVVKQSRLVDKERLAKLLEQFRQNGVDMNNSRAIGNALVEAEAVTAWQCDKLLEGKHKGFFLGKYRLMSLLGKGGMSSVFRADHVLMRRTCAIKVLPVKRVKDSSYLERFYREAQAVASLDHPNIVRAYDVDHEEQKGNEIHFLVMEHVDGNSLQEIVNESGPFEFVQAAEYLRQSAEGLEHAHKVGLVHRDIKPGNLLIDPNGVIKILDLGLAQFFEQKEENPLTVAHDEKVLGTADYLSPEQALDSHKVDIRADIYSLGCTVYFVLTGHPPFNEGTLAQRLMWHQTKQPPPISSDRPDIPPTLMSIIEKMMAKKPDDRYQTAGELSNVLRDWLIEHGDAEWKANNQGLMAGIAVPVAKPVVGVPVESPSASVGPPSTPKPNVAESTVVGTPPNTEVVASRDVSATEPQPAEPAADGLAAFLSNLDAGPTADTPVSDQAPTVEQSAATLATSPALPPTKSTPAAAPVSDEAAEESPSIETAEPQEPSQPTTPPPAKKAAPIAQPVIAEPVVAKPVDAKPAVAQAIEETAAVAAPVVDDTRAAEMPEQNAADDDATIPDFSAVEASGGMNDEDATIPDFSNAGAGDAVVEETATVPDFTAVAPPEEIVPVVQEETPAFPDFSAAESPAVPVESAAAPVAKPAGVPTATPITKAPAKPARKTAAKKKPIVPIIAGISVALVAVICFFVFSDGDDGDGTNGDNVAKNANSDKNGKQNKGKKPQSSSKSKGSQGPTKRYPTNKTEFTVGAAGDFKTIRKALAYVKQHKQDYEVIGRRAKKILFKVAGGETFKHPIHVDDSYPAGIRLIVEGDQKAILAPAGSGPAIKLDNIEWFQMDGFDIKADGFATAIELKGYLNATQLRRLNVSGFTENGIHAISASGIASGDELILEVVTLVSRAADSVGLRISEEGLSRTKILNCRFFGKMSVGILFEGESRYLELRESIFSDTDIGLKFVGGDRVWSDLIVANNTFHGLKRGVVFTNMPKKNSKEIGFYHNLFAAISGPELIIENGYDIKEFNSRLSTLSGGVVQNWSDRPDPGAEPKGGEHLLVINPTAQRVDDFKFVSTDRTNPKFLAPAPNTPYSRIGARRGFKPYVGAVAP